MSPLKTKLQTLAKELFDHANRAEGSAKTHALASLRDPKNQACFADAMKADGRSEAYRHAAQTLEAAAREFIRKVDSGEAHSVRSYMQFKAALDS